MIVTSLFIDMAGNIPFQKFKISLRKENAKFLHIFRSPCSSITGKVKYLKFQGAHLKCKWPSDKEIVQPQSWGP